MPDKIFYGKMFDFCNKLSSLLTLLSHPSFFTIESIKNRIEQKEECHDYIDVINNYNDLIKSITFITKDIFVILNSLFIKKEQDKMIQFVQEIITFMIYLLDENIFIKINKYYEQVKYDIGNCYILQKRLKDSKNTISDIFNICIDIMNIFIPDSYIENDITHIEKYISISIKKIDNGVNITADEKTKTHSIIEIIKKLKSIKLEEIKNVNEDEVINLVYKKNDYDTLINLIENIYVEYINLVNLSYDITYYMTKYNQSINVNQSFNTNKSLSRSSTSDEDKLLKKNKIMKKFLQNFTAKK